MKILNIAWVLVAFLSGGALAAAPAAAPTESIKMVEQLHTALQTAMTDGKKLGYSGRTELLRPVIESSFDFDTITRIVAGRYWKDASAEQRARFAEVFRQLSVASYATNFHESDGETFSTLGNESAQDSVTIHTQLAKTGGTPVTFDYVLRQSNGDWKIVNVIAEGVSDLALKRADYAAVIKAEGFDALIERLRKKVSEMNSGAPLTR